MNYFNIDKVICLCLDKRKDLWMKLKEDAESRGWDFKCFIAGDGKTLPIEDYDHIDQPRPPNLRWSYGNYDHLYWTFMTHKAMIRYAQDNGFKRVMLMEDDAAITSRWDSVCSKLAFEVSQLDYDLLYLGWWIGDVPSQLEHQVTPKLEAAWRDNGEVSIRKIQQAGGLHGIIIPEHMYDFILKMPPGENIDGQLNWYANSLKSYYIAPRVIHAVSSYSFNEGIYYEREVL